MQISSYSREAADAFTVEDEISCYSPIMGMRNWIRLQSRDVYQCTFPLNGPRRGSNSVMYDKELEDWRDLLWSKRAITVVLWKEKSGEAFCNWQVGVLSGVLVKLSSFLRKRPVSSAQQQAADGAARSGNLSSFRSQSPLAAADLANSGLLNTRKASWPLHRICVRVCVHAWVYNFMAVKSASLPTGTGCDQKTVVREGFVCVSLKYWLHVSITAAQVAISTGGVYWMRWLCCVSVSGTDGLLDPDNMDSRCLFSGFRSAIWSLMHLFVEFSTQKQFFSPRTASVIATGGDTNSDGTQLHHQLTLRRKQEPIISCFVTL